MTNPNKMHQITQGTIDNMLAAAARQGEHVGWRKGFLSAMVCVILGIILEGLLHFIG